jgi:hypothetical protein
MITKLQAIQAGERQHSTEIHFDGCKKTIGPRGGVTTKIEKWRPSGKCQTWKTRPDEFSLPIKFGLYQSARLSHLNAHQFHLAEECPLETGSPQEHALWTGNIASEYPE